jgi:hypothetical protein
MHALDEITPLYYSYDRSALPSLTPAEHEYLSRRCLSALPVAARLLRPTVGLGVVLKANGVLCFFVSYPGSSFSKVVRFDANSGPHIQTGKRDSGGK